MRTATARRVILLGLVSVAVQLSFGNSAVASEAGPGFAYGPEQLELVSSERLSDRLLELHFRTPALEDETGVRLLLPDGYQADGDRRYPVLYLLHGCCQGRTGYRSHTEFGSWESLTAGLPLILVMPDSGPEGGYVDWHNHGEGGPPMWETYHLGQLLPWVDQHFRTAASRQARGVVGGSMGGFGAMHYAARHPDLFVAASAWSAPLDSNSVFIWPTSSLDGSQSGKPPSSPNGLRATEEVRWRGHNPRDLAENLDGLALTVRTGNGQPGGPGGEQYWDPVEAEVHEQSVSFHRRLVELGIPHLWDDYGPGCHCSYYWERDTRLDIPLFMAVFADPPPPPSPFTYRSIEPAYEVFGWEVEIDRPAREWSELRNASRNGFTLRGSGAATVTTPPDYRPGRTLDVELVVDGTTAWQRVKVGNDCRLRLEVPLGPGNPNQQYSAQARVDGAQTLWTTPGTATAENTSGTAVYATRVRIDTQEDPGCTVRKSARRGS